MPRLAAPPGRDLQCAPIVSKQYCLGNVLKALYAETSLLFRQAKQDSISLKCNVRDQAQF